METLQPKGPEQQLERGEREERIISPASLDELREILEQRGINLSRWGRKRAKRLEDLWKEIKKGESVLVESEKGFFRRVRVVKIPEIYYKKDGKLYRLKEGEQILADGRKRKRNVPGISEKMLAGEEPITAIARAFREELGIELTEDQIMFLEESGDWRGEREVSSSYPGLTTEYLICSFPPLYLEPHQFRPQYVSEGEGTKSTFVWEEVKEN